MSIASSPVTLHVNADDGLAAFESLTLTESNNNITIDGLLSTTAEIAVMVDELDGLPTSPPSLYIDLEGVNLSRHGTISILQIHVRSTGKNYLVDVYTLKEEAFSARGKHKSTLKAILESPYIPKVIFDVRSDSDALYAHYGIRLAGIHDLQLMELATRFYRKKFVKGLKKCIEEDMHMSMTERLAWISTKDEGVKLFAPEKGGSYEVFNERPLPEKIRIYCVQDVHFLPRLWDLYSRRLTPRWRVKLEEATKARVTESQAHNFIGNGSGSGKGKHLALAPAGWYRD
ncbi:ribonuclease H-like protein [Xylariaceae sp. FL0255]|nr:ribonuclease H-like protein [Xylariaceae sp. FL0255]